MKTHKKEKKTLSKLLYKYKYSDDFVCVLKQPKAKYIFFNHRNLINLLTDKLNITVCLQ